MLSVPSGKLDFRRHVSLQEGKKRYFEQVFYRFL